MNGWVSSLILTTLIGSDLPCGMPTEKIRTLYVAPPAFSMEIPKEPKLEIYRPQAGDIVLFRDNIWFWRLTYRMAFTGPPYHVAIVIQQEDGEYQLLESGPNDTMHVEICPLQCRFQSWNGEVWIRRRAKPLTEAQSKELTQFALRQKGKRYGIFRLGAQATVLRTRGPVRTYYFGKPNGERDSFICAECVLEALVHAGVLDPETTRPSATYPQDLFWDRSTNIYLNKHFKLAPDYSAPQLLRMGD